MRPTLYVEPCPLCCRLREKREACYLRGVYAYVCVCVCVCGNITATDPRYYQHATDTSRAYPPCALVRTAGRFYKVKSPGFGDLENNSRRLSRADTRVAIMLGASKLYRNAE
jgi:hypothetical protein